MATNQGFKSIAFRQANDADYYFHLLEKVKPELVRRASGTTFLEISGAEFGGIVVPSPSTPEKKEISQVLDTLDTAIRETESIISKLKAVKRGLQDDLLTRGINANGELRRSQSEAPHLYKESLLGWIPREWEPVQLGQLLRELGQGWSPDCPPEPASANEWGVLKTTSIVWDGYNENENKRLPNGFKSRTSLEVAADDILITRAGPKTRVGVVVHVVSTRPGLLISDKMYRLRMLDTEIAAYFGLAMSANYAQAAISRTVSGMAESQTNISQGVIKSLLVLRPPRDEQSAIVVRSRSIDERLNCEVMQFGKLRQHKKALMDDLLTGRVRVAPLLERPEQHTLEGSA